MDTARDDARVLATAPSFDGVVVEPSTTPMFMPWMRQPLGHIAASARDLAAVHGVEIDELVLSGFQPPDDDGREIVLTCWVRAADDAAQAFWDDLVEIAYQASASCAAAEDPRLAIAVRWDG